MAIEPLSTFSEPPVKLLFIIEPPIKSELLILTFIIEISLINPPVIVVSCIEELSMVELEKAPVEFTFCCTLKSPLIVKEPITVIALFVLVIYGTGLFKSLLFLLLMYKASTLRPFSIIVLFELGVFKIILFVLFSITKSLLFALN